MTGDPAAADEANGVGNVLSDISYIVSGLYPKLF